MSPGSHGALPGGAGPRASQAMGVVQPVVRGEFAAHPEAQRFAEEVVRVHSRYADEVVGQFQLCPFLRDAASGFGRFCVLLTAEPRLEEVLAAAREADASVVHLVFPCIRTPTGVFERFAARFGDALRRAAQAPRSAGGTASAGARSPWAEELIFPPPTDPKAPVLAAFHPEMAGDEANAHRLVGLLRRAPDPFIQLIPPGLSQGGTVLAGSGPAPEEDRSEALFTRLRGAGVASIRARIAALHAERDARYAPFLEALGLARPGPRFGPAA